MEEERGGKETCRFFSSRFSWILFGSFFVRGFFSIEWQVVTIGGFKIGLIHGHQVVPWGDRESLAIWQRKLDCDVLISGHTHKFEAYAYQGAFFLNPGSATGAYSVVSKESVPTFVLMDVDENTITSYVYRFINDEVDVEKIDYTRPTN